MLVFKRTLLDDHRELYALVEMVARVDQGHGVTHALSFDYGDLCALSERTCVVLFAVILFAILYMY